jgi:uncharacterized protein YndB with AHSA1/START domain
MAPLSVQRLAETDRVGAANVERPTSRPMVIARTVDAPREMVFDAWAEPGQLARWWFGAAAPRMTRTVRRIERPRLLVMVASATDERGNVVLEDETTVTFDEDGERTNLTIVTSVRRAGDATR